MSRPVRSTRSKVNSAKKTTEPQLKITLKDVPHQLVFKILKKMPCVELVRMRKTCIYINKTVEENKEIFAKRIDLGCHLTVGLQTKDNETSLAICNRNVPPQTILMDSTFEDRFSGVSIKTIYVSAIGRNADPQRLLEAFLKKLNLRCVELAFYCRCSLNYLVQLADLVECRTTNFENLFLGYENDPISAFLSGRRKSTYVFRCDQSDILEQLEQLTNFKKVSCLQEMTTEQVHLIIKGIKDLTDFGTLEELSLKFPDANPFLDQNFVFPPTKFLWEMEGIEDHFQQDMKPDYIIKLNLDGDKCALIVKNLRFKEGKIIFITNTPEDVLRILIEELCIEKFESSDRKKYLESSEAGQIELIREIYLRKCTIRRSTRKRGAE